MDRQGNVRPQIAARLLVLGWLATALFLAGAQTGSAWAQVGSARYSALVMEASTGRIVMGVNQDELRFPASLTKLMTLYMTFEALRDRRIQLGQTLTVSASAAEKPPSKLGLQPGEVMTVDQAILGLVTKSANDVAAALGEFLGGSEDRFAQMMTLRARAIGMSRTSFRNASGLPDLNQWTTARDLATLARRLVVDFPQLYGYFAVPGFVWHNRVILNHDTMLRTYPGADGMKTGFTDFAGHNLVTSAVHGGVRLIGVVLGAGSNSERDQHMTVLLDDGFQQVNSPASRFAGGLINLANAATTFAIRPAPAVQARAVPTPAVQDRAVPTPTFVAQAEPQQSLVVSARTTPAPKVARDHGVQAGAYPSERTAREIARASSRLAPSGQPRIQPVVFGRRKLFEAQLVGVSEAEARTVCSGLSRRAPTCQVFRVGTTASR